MVFDFHTHAFPDKIAFPAISKLSGIANMTPFTNGTVNELIRHLDECKIGRATVLNIATNPKQAHNVNSFAIETSKEKRLTPLGSIHPEMEEKDIVGEFARLNENGIKGIKLHPDYMGHAIDEECYHTIFKKCIDNDMFVVIHAGWDFVSPGNIAASPERIRKVVDMFPGLKMISAHFGSNRMHSEVKKHLCGKNIWFDTALSAQEKLDPKIALDIIQNHDPKKILFGSDLPWSSSKNEIDFIKALGLDKMTEDLIFFKNALNLLGEEINE